VTGYSDRINHALAFAAKHHDRQVRMGMARPYLTHPANVAIILTRYGQSEDTVLAGILLRLVEDSLRHVVSREDLEARIVQKFGEPVLACARAAAKRRFDDDGIELSREDQRADFLHRLEHAGEAARWVCTADLVHEAGALLADLRRTSFPGQVWDRAGGGRAGTLAGFRVVLDRLDALRWQAPILEELRTLVRDLEAQPADSLG
jgi:hypothetical protein